MKRILIIFLALTCIIVFAPVIPIDYDKLGYPKNLTDKRVTADISQDDLQSILRTSIGSNFNSLFYLLANKNNAYSKAYLQFESVKNSKSSKLRNTRNKSIRIEPAIGKVVVMLGSQCGPTCGQGIVIYLDKKDGEWYIVRESIWIS